MRLSFETVSTARLILGSSSDPNRRFRTRKQQIQLLQGAKSVSGNHRFQHETTAPSIVYAPSPVAAQRIASLVAALSWLASCVSCDLFGVAVVALRLEIIVEIRAALTARDNVSDLIRRVGRRLPA